MNKAMISNVRDLMEEILLVRYTDLETERKYCIQVLETAKREKNLYALAFGETYLGDYYVAVGNIPKSIEHLQRANFMAIENGFEHLLKVIYNLLGICYESLRDEQTALQYYLKSFQVLQKIPEHSQSATILNNIASNFEQFDDFEEASKYYSKACEELSLLPKNDLNYDYIKLRVFTNYAENYRRMNCPEEMKHYLDLCKDTVFNFQLPKKYLLAKGYCGYYAQVNDFEKSKQYAQEFINLLEKEPYDDQVLILEALYLVCTHLIEIGEKTLAKTSIQCFSNLVSSNKIENIRQLQYLKIQYHEQFEDISQSSDVYYEYYKIMSQTEEIMKVSKSNGLKNILQLDQMKNSLIAEQLNLENEAHLDELTQVYNRRYINKLSTKVVMDTTVKTIGFIMIDIDFFKEYNDTYGHANGDIAIKTVAHILKQNSFENIQASRYGGDEFVCLCTNQTNEQLLDYANKIQKCLSKENLEHKKSHHKTLTLSIGICNKQKIEIQNVMDVLEFADKALYQSKNKGRNTCSFYKD